MASRRLAVGDYLAVEDVHDPARLSHDVGVVGRENEGRLLLLVDLAHKLDDPEARLRVEVGRGLVGQDDEGPRHQRPGDGYPLALAARELVGLVLQPVGEAHFLDEVPHYLRARLPGQGSPEQEGKLDVLEDVEDRNEIEGLEDEADLLAAVAGQLLVAQGLDVGPIDAHDSRGRQVDAAEHVEHRALARARRSCDGEELAPLVLEVDAAQGFDLGLAEHVLFRHSLQFNYRHSLSPYNRCPSIRRR
jgi:hypothetical protein